MTRWRRVAALAAPLLLLSVFGAGSREPQLYVSNEIPNTIAVVSPRTNAVVAIIPVGQRPRGMALSPDRRTLYVSAETNSTVSVLDAKTGRLLHTLHAGDNPRTVALTPDGARAWVSAEAGGNVTIIDVAGDSVVGQFPIRDGKTKPVRIAFSPDGRLAYITEGAAASVSVVDVTRRTVIDSIVVGRRPWGIALSPD